MEQQERAINRNEIYINENNNKIRYIPHLEIESSHLY